jgi:hypothetical protein
VQVFIASHSRSSDQYDAASEIRVKELFVPSIQGIHRRRERHSPKVSRLAIVDQDRPGRLLSRRRGFFASTREGFGDRQRKTGCRARLFCNCG